MKKFLGTVTNEEKAQVQSISMRRNALHELFATLGAEAAEKNNPLYERIVADIGETNERLRNWWTQTATAYGWSFTEKDTWQIEYESNGVYLITPDD